MVFLNTIIQQVLSESFFSKKDFPERLNPVIILINPLPLERINWSI